MVLVWNTIPCFFHWIQILVLYPLVDKTIFFLNDYRHDEEYEKRRDKRYKEGYEEVGVDDADTDRLYAASSKGVTTVTKAQTWMQLRFMDCLIFSRKWYRLLSKMSKILLPLWLWPTMWTIL